VSIDQLTGGNIEPRGLEEEMRSSYLDYAMSVIVARALPDVRDGLKVLQNQLADVGSTEWSLAGEQFLIANGQAVLIAKTADPAVERLRGGVNRRDAARDRRLHPFEVFDQSKVGDLRLLVGAQQNV